VAGKTPWNKIKTEFLRGDVTQAELAEKYHISEKTIRNRAYKEGWKKEKGQIQDKVEQTIRERVTRTRVNRLEKLIQANDELMDAMLLITAEVVQNPHKLIDKAGSLKSAESLSKAIQVLVQNQRDLYNLPTLQQNMQKEAERARRREANARLKLEREKWKAALEEKAKANEAVSGTLWHIEAPEGVELDG